MKKRANGGKRPLPGQVVLVLQGGGALGAYQVGVYQALHEAGIEPDWIVGTSIGAVNGAIIAGNPPDRRIARLSKFWTDIEQHFGFKASNYFSQAFDNAVGNWLTVAAGIPGFFVPNAMLLFGQHARIGTENAGYYTTAPLRRTLSDLVDVGYINERHVRLSLGAVNVRTGEMTYFDSREEEVAMEHVMASSAYPPAFPPVHVKGDYFWDGGIYSNTPIEAVLDDNPRRDSLIFTVDAGIRRGRFLNRFGKWRVGRKRFCTRAAPAAISHARSKSIICDM